MNNDEETRLNIGRAKIYISQWCPDYVRDYVENLENSNKAAALADEVGRLREALKLANEQFANIECRTLDQTLTTPVRWMDWAQQYAAQGSARTARALSQAKEQDDAG